MSEIRRVGVVGCGAMGAGITQVCACAGLDVRVTVSTKESVTAGRQRLVRSFDSGVRRGRITAEERDAALSRVSFGVCLDELGDRQLVFEAVTENEPTKLHVLAGVDKVLDDPGAILASNTSAIPIVRLARATQRPSQVIGVHFFSPVPVIPLVEVIGSLLTGEQTLSRAEMFVTETLGKQAIRSPDRAGFVVNALLIPYLLSAVRMVEAGFAAPEVVDRGMVLGCSHPIGPLKLADLIGLDTIASVAAALYEEFKEPQYSPPPLLLRLVEGGLLGKKTGRGFHDYT
jgi:3-hydroxybutyryl-CoA dehydrogenase